MSDQASTFETEVAQAVEPALTEMRSIRDEVMEVKRSLRHEQENGEAPDTEKVTDLEKRLINLEGELDEARKEARKADQRANEIKAQREAKAQDVFSGMFLRDARGLRELFRDRGIEAVQRALTSGTTLSSAGALNADQEDQFMDWLVQERETLSRINIRRMSSNSAYLDELVTGTRKLVAATEGTAPSVADGFSVARRQLSTVETIWAEDLTYSFIEDNIERGDVEGHIARNLAEGFGNDHNDLYWNGDEDNSDAFLGVNDGIIDIAKADGSVNDHDATSDTAWTAVFTAMLKTLDYKFRSLNDLAFFIPSNGVYTYMEEIKDRATALGDAVMLNGRSALRYFGIPIIGEPHLDAGDEAVLTPLRNLMWGVQRGITFEAERNPRKRVIEYTISARTDHNYSKSDAVVLADNLASSLTD